MLGLVAYARYAESPASKARYTLVLICLVLGLMSKATLVVFPFVLLLLDFWPLGRLREGARKAVIEKVPMIALAVGASAITYWEQKSVGSMRIGSQLGVAPRIVNAMETYWLFLRDVVWPSGLAAMYPHPYVLEPVDTVDVGVAFGLALGLLVISWLTLVASRTRPYLLVGWLWYLGVLVPMIGFVQVGLQARADRYMYLPLVGLSIMVAWGAGDLAERSPSLRRVVVATALASLAAMTVATRLQVEHWADSISLFSRIVSVTENNRFAHEKLAIFLSQDGRNAEAAFHFEQALRIEPTRRVSRFGLAAVYERMGDDESAIESYQIGVRLQPGKVRARGALGVLLARAGRHAEAQPHLLFAIDVLPADASYQLAMGHVAVALGRPGEALGYYAAALRLQPDLAEAAEALTRLRTSSEDPAPPASEP
jgi:tetratricopeptide (TPR) repeat protein